MKTSFTAITVAWPNRRAVPVALAALLIAGAAWSFKTEMAATGRTAEETFLRLEAGLLEAGVEPDALIRLAAGDYTGALSAITPGEDAQFPWLRPYLEGTIAATRGLALTEGEHFRVFAPEGHAFLAAYALEALEKAGDHFEGVFGHRPSGKIVVEIFPDKESFSAASTLSLETLERSGAIGICKFHRLMILSPGALPMGYRWLDALSHEYMHLMINELTHAKAELWLHEGTARYFETSYRVQPPAYLTPNQKTALMEAHEKGTLVPFRRMSPSMVYLKDQREVSLAFGQVSHAVDTLVDGKGLDTFRKFFAALKKKPFPEAFRSVYKMTPEAFETRWQAALGKEKWEKARGALSDEVRFEALREDEAVGAGAQARIRLGDRMRMRGHLEAAMIEYDKALAEEPDNALILLKAARARLALNRKGEATDLLRRAVEKNPNYATPMIELAGLTGDDEAERNLLEANAINPFDPRVHAGLAAIYARQGRADAAAREGEIAAALGAGR